LPAVLLCCSVYHLNGQAVTSLPRLVKKNTTTQLYVDEKPFLILGGETGNSSASSMDYMRPYWSKFQSMHLNTVLAPVYWELMEPEEGRFDFSLTDSLLSNASAHRLKLVLLWFGTWKNSMSCYTPLWIKKNTAKFTRTQDKNNRSMEIISAFSTTALEADKKAFAALMRHLKETDLQHTVIMVQVENEIGMLSTAREISATANTYFNAQVPAELIAWLLKNKNNLSPELYEKWKQQQFVTKGNWAQLFGEGLATEEIFQAWYYAKFANSVAAAGKTVYPVPMYVNAALNRPGVKPGDYPSAGPLPQVMDMWRAAAPAIDIFSPDFYNPDTKYWCDLYTRNGNPLFIPEMRLEPSCAAKVFYVIGHYGAIGFSPFSIEDAAGLSETSLSKSYAVLQQLSPFILNQRFSAMEGILSDKVNRTDTIQMNDYVLTVSHDYTLGWSPLAKDSIWPVSGCTIIQTGKDDFMVAGTGIVITFASAAKQMVANIASADEVRYENGVEIKGRRMNGDQDHQGRHIRIPVGEWGIQKVSVYQSPAAIEK